MVNNKDLIIPLMNAVQGIEFYYLQILQRKKEHPDIDTNSRVVKNYYVTTPEYLEARWEEIVKLCEVFDARACFRLNKRSWRKVAFKALQKHAEVLANNEYPFCRKSYDRAIGQSHHDPVKKWILDIDEPDEDGEIRKLLKEIIADLQPNPEENKIVAELPSKSGWHLITTPFNVQAYMYERDQYDIKPVDIHKDNPTNLYIP